MAAEKNKKRILRAYTRVPKEPDPYKDDAYAIKRYAGYTAFQDAFNKRLKQELQMRYPQGIVNNILYYLSNNRLLILNKELFFSDVMVVEDIDNMAFEKGVTLERYLRDIVFEVKRQISLGSPRIVLTSFLVNVAKILEEAERAEIRLDDIYSLMNNFVLCISSIGSESPVYIRILDDKLVSVISEKWKIDTDKYRYAVKLYFNAMTKVFDTRQKTAVEIPKVEYLRAAYYERDYETLKRIEKKFRIPFNKIEDIFDEVDVRTPSTEFQVALERVQRISENKETDVQSFMNLITHTDSVTDTSLHTYENFYPLKNEFSAIQFFSSFNKTRLYNKYINIDFFRESKYGVFSNIFVHCDGYNSFREIEPLIDCAHRLNLLRIRSMKKVKHKSSPLLKITLLNTSILAITEIEKLKNS